MASIRTVDRHDETTTGKDGRLHRRLSWLFGLIAAVAAAQIVVTLPRWDEGSAKVSVALAVVLLVLAAVQSARSWRRSRGAG